MDATLHAQAFEEVMADVEKLVANIERLKLQLGQLEAVAAYHKEKAVPHVARTESQLAAKPHPATNGAGRFARVGQREAARIVLVEAGEPLNTAQIAERLIEGGFPMEIAKLKRNLFTNLRRARHTFCKAGSGTWSLVNP